MSISSEPFLRSLPDIPDILLKLQSGVYTLHGGVVRHAAGTSQGGQIVGHLLFPGDAFQTQQSIQSLQTALSNGIGSLEGGIAHLQQSMNVLQGLQTANLVISGLNLAVSAAGFVVVCKKLNEISSQIHAQSQGILQTLQLVGEVYDRSLLLDEARFRSLLLSSQQFCEQGNKKALNVLIPQFHQEYQFTKLILEKHALIAASNIDCFSEIALLQDRLLNLGLMMSHVQLIADAPKYAQEFLMELAKDIATFNTRRIEALMSDRAVASRMSATHLADLTAFLQNGSAMVHALSYRSDVIGLDTCYPGLLPKVLESKEILLVFA